MECKKCGVDLADKEYKKVAEWPFCLECFQALMDKAGDLPARAQKPADIQQRCRVCEKEIEKGKAREMLGLVFCVECYENLVKRPDIKPRTESEEEEIETRPVVAQVRVDLRQPIQCHRCGRQVPALGSKDFEGNSYCPDCYCALPEIKAQKPKPFPVEVSDQGAASTEELKTGLKCQACSREVLPENLKTIDGFEICRACLSTDPDTALEIARARHRKVLEQIKKDFDA